MTAVRLLVALMCMPAAALQSQRDADVLRDLARALDGGHAEQGRAIAERLAGEQPMGFERLLEAGALLGQHEMYAEAAKIFEKCVRENPRSFEGAYNLALARLALADYAGALNALEKADAHSADQAAAREYMKGKVYAATDRNKEAALSMETAFRAKPEENYALDLGLLYLRTDAYPSAVEVLERATRAHPDSGLLAVELGLAYALAGRHADAIRVCREPATAGGDASLTRLIEAFSACSTGEYRACESAASAGLALPHPRPYLYYLRASARLRSDSHDYEDLLRDLDAAVSSVPGCGPCRLARSNVYEKQGKVSDAIADLQRAVAADPGFAQAWYKLASLERRAGHTDEASRALARYRELHDTGAEREREIFRHQAVGAIKR
ncbi:MAG: tetratricopeptide repeat protein [Bryobacteraceae bacterium]